MCSNQKGSMFRAIFLSETFQKKAHSMAYVTDTLGSYKSIQQWMSVTSKCHFDMKQQISGMKGRTHLHHAGINLSKQYVLEWRIV